MLTLLTKCNSTPRGYISARVGFLRRIVTSVHKYEEDKEWRRFVSVGKGNNPLELAERVGGWCLYYKPLDGSQSAASVARIS